MLTTVQGVYKNGKVELSESPSTAADGSPVLVTFLRTGDVDLQAVGISKKQAAELRSSLGGFAVDWEAPEMGIYDDYDSARSGR
jgi:hypothetical protein